MMRNSAIIFFCILSVVLGGEEAMRFIEYSRFYGYPAEEHIIHTEDHYNLQFHRIQAKNTNITAGKRVVCLMHGFAGSSDIWVVNNQSLAPAFSLANQGFDVWVGNSRGNRYNTLQLSPNASDFWNFSIHEMAMYDLPAAFGYIHNITHRKIHYVGHSQGATIMIIALTEKVKGVQQFLNSFVAYAPSVYFKHHSSGLLKIIAKTPVLSFLNAIGVRTLFLYDDATLLSFGKICTTDTSPCADTLTEVSEMNNTVNNLARSSVIIAHFPAGSSVKNVMHVTQLVNKNVFRRYNYGKKKNKVIYGQSKPPLYDLSKITFPVHICAGRYDRLASVKDSARLFKELTNSVNKTMKIYDFGHATFLWGKTLVHVDDTISIINDVEAA